MRLWQPFKPKQINPSLLELSTIGGLQDSLGPLYILWGGRSAPHRGLMFVKMPQV